MNLERNIIERDLSSNGNDSSTDPRNSRNNRSWLWIAVNKYNYPGSRHMSFWR